MRGSPRPKNALPDYVVEALAVLPDESAEFTAKVAGIRSALSEILGRRVDHDPDMNYRAGQILRIWVGEDGRGDSNDPRYQLALLLSARRPLYAFIVFVNAGAGRRGPWTPGSGPVPSNLDGLISEVREGLARERWREVPGDVLSRPAPGHATAMDGAPATVQEALFAEII